MEFFQVDGIVCFCDPDGLRRDQGEALAESWFAGNGALSEERVLAGVFAQAHYSARNADTLARLGAWLDRHALGAGTALEIGCGPGRFLFELCRRFAGGAVGLDLRVGLLRIAARLLERGEVEFPWQGEAGRFAPMRLEAPARTGVIRLFQGSLVHAPFAPRSFALVAALSLLDVLPDPRAGLDRLDALVAPGGLLLLACPYHWSEGNTPRERWMDGVALRTALQERGYATLEEDDLAWAVPAHRRLVHEYLLDALLLRKPS